VIPVTRPPEVGVADPVTFNQLDTSTRPQFTFISPSGGMFFGTGGFSDSSGGFGCASDSAAAPDRALSAGFAPRAEEDRVEIWNSGRVGNYETVTISGETAEDLLGWLGDHGYDIPDTASGIIDQYIAEEHMFVAFRYDPILESGGTLDPVVLTYRPEPDDSAMPEMCVPIRITAIASTPILDVMILVFGEERALPTGSYVTTEPDYDEVQQDFTMGGGTSYQNDALNAITEAGDLAFVTEFARPTEMLAQSGMVTDLEARAILARNRYVTRLYTRFTPESMIADPEFMLRPGSDVTNIHTVDLRFSRAEPKGSGARFAIGPGVMIVAGLALAWRRRRR
jgi:hypothetical protein